MSAIITGFFTAPALSSRCLLVFVAVFPSIFLFLGCPKNTGQTAVGGESLYWTEPGAEVVIAFFVRDPLVLQFSADPVVYVSHIPPDAELSEIEREEGIIVKPSELADVPSKIEAYKSAQESAGRDAVVLIAGDDRAPCKSIITGVDFAKCANIGQICFEINYLHETGMARQEPHGCLPVCYFEFPKGFKNRKDLAPYITTVTISYDGKIKWNGVAKTMEEFVCELLEHSKKIGPDRALMEILVEADTPFPYLRYVLEQMRRIGISRVMTSLVNS